MQPNRLTNNKNLPGASNLHGHELSISRLDKGLPYDIGASANSFSAVGWNVFEAMHLPLLLLKESPLGHNLKSMAQWCSDNGLALAPHGKTTMCPQIFWRQMEHGAWGITVATASQAIVCAEAGIRRILLANQVIGRANAQSLAAIMKSRQDVEILCVVDSIAGVEFLCNAWRENAVGRPIGVLLELGRAGWRTGARSIGEALAVHAEILRSRELLDFRGIEAFEGIVHGIDHVDEGAQVDKFFSTMEELGKEVIARTPRLSEPLLCSMGGSAYLDCVSRFAQRMRPAFQVVLRSGCYVTHDNAYYAEKHEAALGRDGNIHRLPRFEPALELWSHVQSTPEAGLAILNFGKRDCSYDVGLPVPLFMKSRAGGDATPLAAAQVSHCNDQHAYLRHTSESLRVGDLVCCGISHPCTAFDKWRLIPVVDDSYCVVELYRTFF